jgi:uncharacterized protein (DUF1800 family)
MTDRASLAAFRFGYGLPLPDGAPVDPGAMMAALRGPDLAARRWQGIGMAQAMPLYQAAALARGQARTSPEAKADYRDKVKAVEDGRLAAAQATLARAVGSPDGLRERLVQFWADHFTAIGRFRQDRMLPAAMIEDVIRPHVAGRFADMLKGAVIHPAMLIYLDQSLSVGPGSTEGKRRKRGLNENLARELLELHTLGVGSGYSQADVRQMAELLTGLTVDPAVGLVFRETWVEPGPEEVLGRVYQGEGVAPILSALEDLAVRPETAAHIARKLVVHFVSDDPDEALVIALATVWRETGGDLGAVVDRLVSHPAAWMPAMTKARQPFDFIAAALRALGVGGDEVMGLGRGLFRRHLFLPMEGMGQPWGEPRGPDGWPEEAAAWITPQGMAARIQWAMDMPAEFRETLPEPVDLAHRALGGFAGERLLWAVARAENRREGVGLVLAAPEFNKR